MSQKAANYTLFAGVLFLFLSPITRAAEPVEFAAGEILLKFKETTQTIEKTAFEKEFGLVLLRESGATAVCLYQSKEENVLIIIDKIIKNKNIEFAEPNYVQKKDQSLMILCIPINGICQKLGCPLRGANLPVRG